MNDKQMEIISNMLRAEEENLLRLGRELPEKLRAYDVAESRYLAVLDVLEVLGYEYDEEEGIHEYRTVR